MWGGKEPLVYIRPYPGDRMDIVVPDRNLNLGHSQGLQGFLFVAQDLLLRLSKEILQGLDERLILFGMIFFKMNLKNEI